MGGFSLASSPRATLPFQHDRRATLDDPLAEPLDHGPSIVLVEEDLHVSGHRCRRGTRPPCRLPAGRPPSQSRSGFCPIVLSTISVPIPAHNRRESIASGQRSAPTNRSSRTVANSGRQPPARRRCSGCGRRRTPGRFGGTPCRKINTFPWRTLGLTPRPPKVSNVGRLALLCPFAAAPAPSQEQRTPGDPASKCP